MRNDREYDRNPETVEVDHARRRLLMRLVIIGAIVFVTGAYVYSKVSSATETAEGQRGFMWGIILLLSIELALFIWYVASAYTPIFKVMPKGEIYRLRNWGRRSKKKASGS